MGATPRAERRELGLAASRQHGVISREQMVSLGLGRGFIQNQLNIGGLILVHRGVYRFPAAPQTWEQQAMAAQLAAGGDAVVSHRSAARVWGLGQYDEIEITVSRSRLPRIEGVVVHRSRDLHFDRRARRNGLPVTTPMRAVVDLGAVVPAADVEVALDLGLTAKLFTYESIERHRARIARPGRRGSGVLRAVLDERALGFDVPESLLESRMARLMLEAGLPLAQYQFEVRVNGVLIARVDFAYPELKLAIEVDGWAHHHTPSQMTIHLRRQNRLVAAGWTILRFTWLDLVRRPHEVVAEIRRALGAFQQRMHG